MRELSLPIIASVNCVSGQWWTGYASQLKHAGASVVQVASALYRSGVNHIGTLNSGVADWMQSKGYASLSEFRGMLCQQAGGTPARYERLQYINALTGIS